MPIKIQKTITYRPLESVLRAVEQHKPITCLGVAVRHEVRRVLEPSYCKHIDTAEEYEGWLNDHGVLLEEPKNGYQH